MKYSVQDIEGIGPVNGAKLADAGVWTTDDLLRVGGDVAGRKVLSKQAGFDKSRLLGWVDRADLMRVSGIGEEYADLLEHAGVDTVKELATRNAENLVEMMEKVNAEKKLTRGTPKPGEVQKWIKEADKLKPMVSY